MHRNDPGRNRRFADVMTQSGALSVLAPFRVRRARPIGGDALSTAGLPSGGVTVEQVEQLIADALAAFDPGVGGARPDCHRRGF